MLGLMLAEQKQEGQDILATHRSKCQVDLYYRQRSNINTPIESPHATSYLIAIAMLAKSVTILDLGELDHDL